MFKSLSNWFGKLYHKTGFKDSKLRQSYLRPGWQKAKRLPWRHWASLRWAESGLEFVVSLVLKLGTLALVSFFLFFFFRLFSDQGYVLQSFSVPKTLEEQGYSGQVLALRIQDELTNLKEIAGSVKEDSLQLKEDTGDIDLAVLGVGLSLRSLAFQLREVMGKENKTLRGEITRVGELYEAQIRMTGYPKIVKEQLIDDDEQAAIKLLIRQTAEGILYHTDPYRLALVCRKEKRYKEATATIRHILNTREEEAHWAYLCWGAMLNERNEKEEAIDKLERAIAIKPDFSLPYINISWIYLNLDRPEEGLAALKSAIKLEPERLWNYSSLAWMYHNIGEHESADSTFKAVMEHPLNTDMETRMKLATGWGEMKLQRDDVAGASEIIEKYVDASGENVISYLIRGISALAEQDTVRLLEEFAKAFEIDPSNQVAIAANISFNSQLGFCEQAISFKQRADWSDLDENSQASNWNQVAMCYNKLGQTEAAYTLIWEAININPEMASPYTTLAETHAYLQQMDSCYYYLEKAFQLGFSVNGLPMEEWPYFEMKNELPFQQLVKKYNLEKSDL